VHPLLSMTSTSAPQRVTSVSRQSVCPLLAAQCSAAYTHLLSAFGHLNADGMYSALFSMKNRIYTLMAVSHNAATYGQSLYTSWKRLGESRYSSYSFSTSALDGCDGQRHSPAALLPPGKGPPVPIVQETGWAPEPVWTQRLDEKSFALAGDRTPISRSSCS
jgi:hypothetical protein